MLRKNTINERHGLYRLYGKTRVFLRSEGYGLQPVHKGTKTMGFSP
jgi:hypothetical protein